MAVGRVGPTAGLNPARARRRRRSSSRAQRSHPTHHPAKHHDPTTHALNSSNGNQGLSPSTHREADIDLCPAVAVSDSSCPPTSSDGDSSATDSRRVPRRPHSGAADWADGKPNHRGRTRHRGGHPTRRQRRAQEHTRIQGPPRTVRSRHHPVSSTAPSATQRPR